MGVCLGFMQQFRFASHLRWRWFRATAIGWGVGGGLIGLGLTGRMGFEVAVFVTPVVGLVASIVLQTWVLRAITPQAKWWGWIVVASLLTAFLVGGALGFLSLPLLGTNDYAGIVGGGAFAMVWFGAMAAGLTWLVSLSDESQAPAAMGTAVRTGGLSQAIMRGIAYAILAWITTWLITSIIRV